MQRKDRSPSLRIASCGGRGSKAALGTKIARALRLPAPSHPRLLRARERRTRDRIDGRVGKRRHKAHIDLAENVTVFAVRPFVAEQEIAIPDDWQVALAF